VSDGVPCKVKTREYGKDERHDRRQVGGIAALLPTRRTVFSADMENGVRRADPIDSAVRQSSGLRPVDGKCREPQRRGAAVQRENGPHPDQRQF
jgi:hypothetical protein